jgi:hypothetical protein
LTLKKSIVLVTLILLFPISVCWFTVDSLPLQGPVILQLDSSKVVQDGATQLGHYVDDARIIPVYNQFELTRFVSKAIDQVFYVGHGSDDGLTVSSDMVSWTSIRALVESSGAREHYFAACFSQFPKKPDGKIVMGFDGVVDVDVATNLVAAVSYGVHNRLDKWPELARAFIANRGFEKLLNPETPLITVTPTVLPGTTPYGWVNPLAIEIVITELEVSQYGTGAALAALVLAALGGGLGAALALYIGGIAWTLNAVWAHDKQGTYPNRYIQIWIPIDAVNMYLIHQGLLWYIASPGFWWACLFGYGFLIGYR